MKNPKIKTKVIHSQSKPAWNVVGTKLCGKYKIARVPYVVTNNDEVNEIEKKEAFEHAEFISYCFNNSEKILNLVRVVISGEDILTVYNKTKNSR